MTSIPRARGGRSNLNHEVVSDSVDLWDDVEGRAKSYYHSIGKCDKPMLAHNSQARKKQAHGDQPYKIHLQPSELSHSNKKPERRESLGKVQSVSVRPQKVNPTLQPSHIRRNAPQKRSSYEPRTSMRDSAIFPDRHHQSLDNSGSRSSRRRFHSSSHEAGKQDMERHSRQERSEHEKLVRRNSARVLRTNYDKEDKNNDGQRRKSMGGRLQGLRVERKTETQRRESFGKVHSSSDRPHQADGRMHSHHPQSYNPSHREKAGIQHREAFGKTYAFPVHPQKVDTSSQPGHMHSNAPQKRPSYELRAPQRDIKTFQAHHQGLGNSGSHARSSNHHNAGKQDMKRHPRRHEAIAPRRSSISTPSSRMDRDRPPRRRNSLSGRIQGLCEQELSDDEMILMLDAVLRGQRIG